MPSTASPPHRIFLLSPASTTGRRAGYLLNPTGRSELARRLHGGAAVPLGELFAFLSGLYFRGKLGYGVRFGRAPQDEPGALVITPHRGLLSTTTPTSLDDLRAFAAGSIDAANESYRTPLLAAANRLAAFEECEFVLLGSIATPKYVEPLLQVFGDRLLYPSEFEGRGDMSRGGLLLRCIDENRELEYVPVQGAIRRGSRPPKLAPR
jgi:hypothetical protein